MATILEALRSGVIRSHMLPEYEGRDPLRPLYLADSFYDWVDANETLHLESWGRNTGGRSRYEHMEQAFCDFRCDERPLVCDLNRVMPTKKGVWKVQCPGLRIYGWVPDERSLLLVTAAFNEDVHGPNSITSTKVKEVLTFAKVHDLEGTIQYGERSAYFQKEN